MLVTISFNQAQFLEQAILSVIEQDYKNIEYIIVDPGSTDGSRDIIEHYRNRISKVILEPDKGPADGLNRGFSCATGDIYGFLNSDDILLFGAISAVVAYFTKNKGIDLISGNGFIINKEGKYLRKVFSDNFSLLLDAYGQCVLVQPSSFFKSQIFKEVGGFNVRNHSNWDGELFYRMAIKKAHIIRVNDFWSGYRLYPESITGSAMIDNKIRTYSDRKFEEIMGRKKKWFDLFIILPLKIFKHISNPKALYERLVKGKIYGQG